MPCWVLSFSLLARLHKCMWGMTNLLIWTDDNSAILLFVANCSGFYGSVGSIPFLSWLEWFSSILFHSTRFDSVCLYRLFALAHPRHKVSPKEWRDGSIDLIDAPGRIDCVDSGASLLEAVEDRHSRFYVGLEAFSDDLDGVVSSSWVLAAFEEPVDPACCVVINVVYTWCIE